MNKVLKRLLKIFVAILGACNYAMQLVMPIFIGLVIFNLSPVKTWNVYLLVVVSALASLYQGSKIFIKE